MLNTENKSSQSLVESGKAGLENQGSHYRFPKYKDEEDRNARLFKLKELKNSGGITGRIIDKYDEYRQEICAVHIRLNEGGGYAPFFRKGPKNRPHFDRTKPYPDRSLSNDLQAVDLHWLWLYYRKEIITEEKKFQKLFEDNECFDFDFASELVGVTGETWLKAEILNIPEHIQMELASIQAATTRGLKKQVLNVERRKAAKLIRSNSGKLNSHNIQEWADFYVVLRLARGDSQRALRLYRVMKGGDPWKDDETAKRLMDKKRLKLERSYIQISRGDWKSEALFGSARKLP